VRGLLAIAGNLQNVRGSSPSVFTGGAVPRLAAVV